MNGHLKIVICCILCWSLSTFVQATLCFADGVSPMKEELYEWHPRNARVAIRNDNNLDCERPDIYICEEPPDLVYPDPERTCNYRNVDHQEQVFRWVAGWGCLLYTHDFLFVGGANSINMSGSCIYENLLAPCVEIPKQDGTCGCYPFDPGLEEVVEVVRNAIVPAAHGRWERCYAAAKDCCSQHVNERVLRKNQTHCGATFDGWTCWHGAPAGTTAVEVCSEFAYSNVGPSCHHFSSKQCFLNGTWELQTDYRSCSIAPRLIRRYRFHIAMLSFSIISCLPAVLIFFFYKRLRITRVALHRNLLIVVMIRNVLVIVSRSEILMDELTNSGDTAMSVNSVWCRMLSFTERFASNAVFVCMLVEGVYLHRLIVAVFKKRLNIKWLYLGGAIIAIAPVLAWAVVMALYDDHSCWLVYTTGFVQWILDTPRVAILLINTVLFIHVMRVLLTKIRNSENANQLSTAKTTLFLLPIFGVQFLLTAFRPNTNNCTAEQAYYYVAYTIEGLQGFIIAMLYCYINKEVRMLVKTTYKKTESAFVSRVRGESTYPRPSMNREGDRRLTYSTGLPSQNDLKHEYATITPKLHVAEIISIQASERLAEILEPVYETIDNGMINDGYESYGRSEVDSDSGCIANRDFKIDDYYGFTNVSSVSIDCPDWIRCVSSPTSSVYNNSLNDYETRYLEKKFSNQAKIQDFERKRKLGLENTMETVSENIPSATDSECTEVEKKSENDDYKNDVVVGTKVQHKRDDSEEEDCESMLEEIMQYIECNDDKKEKLDPNVLSPNRKDEDKILFVDE